MGYFVSRVNFARMYMCQGVKMRVCVCVRELMQVSKSVCVAGGNYFSY